MGYTFDEDERVKSFLISTGPGGSKAPVSSSSASALCTHTHTHTKKILF
jgi:hypothetical protein